MDPADPEEELPQTPKLKTWRGVYLFVLFAFVAMVGLMAWFTHAFAP